MTTAAQPSVTETLDAIGVVGHRSLIAVQTWEIARLTPHPVPLVPAQFIAVSGTGPDGDSNGSGKTSFLAAVSLLLCDAQWRLETSGYQNAPELLFDPESAGLERGLGYRQSDHGYIVGVFADETGSVDGALTVCLRISSSTPYLKARWATGVHLVKVTDSEVLEAQFDELWSSFPQTKKDELGPKHMKTVLYGKAAKGIAYIDTSMRTSAPSLLSQELTQMSPEQIGTALIELTGRQGLLEREEVQRSLLAEQQSKLTARQEQDRTERISEEQQLEAVRHRDRARAALADGERLWTLHYARGYLDTLKDDRDLEVVIGDLSDVVERAQITANEAREKYAAIKDSANLQGAVNDAQRAASMASEMQARSEREHNDHQDALRKLDEERQRLQLEIRRGEILPLRTAEAQERTAAEKSQLAAQELRDSLRSLAEARKTLEEVGDGAGGEAGEVLSTLGAAGIEGRLLIDEVRVTDEARARWEPILWAYRTAVVVSHDLHPTAVDAVRSLPGSVVVSMGQPEDASAFPDGVQTDLPIGTLLQQLARRYDQETDPDRAVDTGLGLHIIGGFSEPIAGRTARVAHAERQLAARQGECQSAKLEADAATSALELATAAHERAKAAVRLQGVEEDRALLASLSDAKVEALTRTAEVKVHADEDLVNAKTALASHATNVELARTKRTSAEEALTRTQSELRGKVAERQNLRLDYWTAGWGDTPEAAASALEAAEISASRMTRRSLKNRSSEHLKDAMEAHVQSLGGGDIPYELATAIDRRQKLADTDRPGFGRDEVSFESVARPLRDHLDIFTDMDQQLQARIDQHQRSRIAAIEGVSGEIEQKQQEWDRLQDMIAGRIERSLQQISVKVDQLVRASGGWGAELKVTEKRPTTATGTWRWEVAPRWKRSPSGSMVDYHHNANGAQIKVFAIKLVLAALLADEGAGGRVLVIDELGNSLGDVNRRVVLRDISQVAREQGVTILGTCQDSVIDDAGKECGQVLWFSHASVADATNQPTRMWDYDGNRERVELTVDHLTAGRTLV